RYVRCSQDGYFAVIRLSFFDRFERQSRQNGTNRSAATVGFRNTRGDADILVTALREKSGCHPLAVFFPNRIDDIKIVIDLCRAKIQGRSLLAADGFISFELRRSQCRCYTLQAPHGFCDPRVRLSVPDARSNYGCRYKASGGKNADEES